MVPLFGVGVPVLPTRERRVPGGQVDEPHLGADVALLCVPHKVAMDYVPALLNVGLKHAFQNAKADPLQFAVAREVFKNLERVTDAFEDVANQIDGIVIDHA